MSLTPERLREWIDRIADVDTRLAHPALVHEEVRDDHDGAVQDLDAVRDEMVEVWRDLLAKEVA